MPPQPFRSLLALVLVACALPVVGVWMGLDLGIGMDDRGSVDPRIIHTLLEWSAFAVALATVALCIAHHRSHGRPIVLIVAVAALSASAIDATHTLTAARLIPASTEDFLLCPITWTLSRTLFIAIIVIGSALLMRKATAVRRAIRYLPLLAVTGLLSVAVTTWLSSHPNLPPTVFPDGIFKHPFDAIPLALFTYAGLRTIPMLRRHHDGIFVSALHLSILPSTVAQLHMLFGSQQLFDHDFVAAHLLKIVSYLVPIAALAFDYQQARRDAAASGQIFRSIFESSPDPVFVINSETDSIVDANGKAAELLGYGRDELLKMRISDIHPDEMDKLKAFAEVAMRAGSATTESLTCLSKDGRKIPAEISGAFFIDEHGDQLMIAQVRDISPRLREAERHRQLERQLTQAQKMEAIGRLAGGIAHDFNNMLTVINGYAEIALEKAEDPLMRTCAKAVLDAGGRAANLTGGLLAFSRSQIQQKEVLNLNQVIDSLRSLLKRIISEDIDLACILSEQEPQVLMDRGQLDQVIMNLMINARDAMPDGGQLTVETRFAEPGESDKHLLDPGQYAVVSVTDTGSGMDAEIQKQVFDPFFTTKEVGSGTGLGLSTVYGIVTQCKGSISVQSSKGEGTTFTVFLPLDTTATDQKPSSGEIPLHSGRAHVLVVEDDELVRDLVCQTLERNGFLVDSADNGATGLELFAKHINDIDLLVTDIVMPEMSGIDLAREARRSLPKLHVLFMSGHADRVDIANTPLEGMVLRKPFSLRDLHFAVNEALKPRQPST